MIENSLHPHSDSIESAMNPSAELTMNLRFYRLPTRSTIIEVMFNLDVEIFLRSLPGLRETYPSFCSSFSILFKFK
jgi:hypothetical protein